MDTESQLSYLNKGFTSILIMNHKLGLYGRWAETQSSEYLLNNLAPDRITGQ